jgi:hypothetical protein
MSARTFVPEWLWPRDRRSTEEIADGIREELESHVERLVDEQIRAGVPEEEARGIAAARFGDVERYAAECRRIDLGGRLIVHRSLVIACAALLAACTYLGWRVVESRQTAAKLKHMQNAVMHLQMQLAAQQQASQQSPNSPLNEGLSDAACVERLLRLSNHMQAAFAVGPVLTLFPPDRGVAIMREAWPQINVRDVKTGLLKAFAFSKALEPDMHPRLLAVLDLGMRDADPEVRSYAANYLREYAREDLSADADRYAEWYDTYGGMTPDDVLRATVETVPVALEEQLGDVEQLLRDGELRELWDVARELGDAGHPYAIPTLIGIIDADNSYDTVYGVGYFGLGKITSVKYSPFHDGAWWRRWWERNKGNYPSMLQRQSIPEFPKTAHGRMYAPYPEYLDALDGLLRYFERGVQEERFNYADWAQAVAEFEDPAAIPFLIGVIDADNTYDTVYGVGYFGLGPLTGVTYSESHDGAWWREWWEKNKSRYPASAQATPIPDLKGIVQAARGSRAKGGAGWQFLDALRRAYR